MFQTFEFWALAAPTFELEITAHNSSALYSLEPFSLVRWLEPVAQWRHTGAFSAAHSAEQYRSTKRPMV